MPFNEIPYEAWVMSAKLWAIAMAIYASWIAIDRRKGRAGVGVLRIFGVSFGVLVAMVAGVMALG